MTRAMRIALDLSLVAILGAAAATGHAAAYPEKAIRIIVPFPAGGGYDFLARLIGQKLGEAWGQAVVVDNRVGANGNIGAELVANAPPDGYTLIMSGNGPHALNAGLYPKLPYDPVKDFAPVTLVATQPNLLTVHPSLPVKSVKELVQFAKARPGQLTYASNGNGSGQHIATEQFKQMAGIDMVHVPYKGAAPALSALLAGEVPVAFNIILLPLPYVQAGKLRALAVASSKRAPLAPTVPTMTESGYPIDIDTWYGVLAPAGTPTRIVNRLNIAIVHILNLPEVKERTAAQGIDVVGSTPDRFMNFMKSEIAKWSAVIGDLKITID